MKSAAALGQQLSLAIKLFTVRQVCVCVRITVCVSSEHDTEEQV